MGQRGCVSLREKSNLTWNRSSQGQIRHLKSGAKPGWPLGNWGVKKGTKQDRFDRGGLLEEFSMGGWEEQFKNKKKKQSFRRKQDGRKGKKA